MEQSNLNYYDTFVVCPYGYGVDLREARLVTPVREESENYVFSLYFKGLSSEHKFNFLYPFSKYKETKPELKVKVENIRADVMRRMNGGRQAAQINGSIQLQKNG